MKEKFPITPVSWEEMDMELDIISLSFKKKLDQESTKYIKYKRSLAKPRFKSLKDKNPDLKTPTLTEQQKEEIQNINNIQVTKNVYYVHKDFDCSNNSIESLSIGRQLGKGFLQGVMYDLPECISSFNNLKKIIFSDHQVDRIPASFSAIKTLEVIKLPKNRLSSLPNNLVHFTSLKELVVSDNFILDFPKDYSFPLEIEQIDLSNNYLTTIPKQLLKLEHLKKLNIKGNNISRKEVAKLKKKLKNCEVIF